MDPKDSSASGGSSPSGAPEAPPNRSFLSNPLLGMLTGTGGMGGMGSGIVPKLLGKSMAWPGLGGAFPGMMGGKGGGAGWPPLYPGAAAGPGAWPPYPGGGVPGSWGAPAPSPGFPGAWGGGFPGGGAPQAGNWNVPQGAPQPGSWNVSQGAPQAGNWNAPQGAPQPGSWIAPPGGPQAGGWIAPPGDPQAGGWIAPPGGPQAGSWAAAPQPAGWTAGGALPPQAGWPPSAAPPPAAPPDPSLSPAPGITAATPASPAIEGDNTFQIPGATVVPEPGGSEASSGSWLQPPGQTSFAPPFVPPPAPVPPPSGPQAAPLGSAAGGAAPAGFPPGAFPAGIGIPGIDPNFAPGLNEEAIPKAIASIDPNWVQKWQHYQGWPFSAPPFPFVPDQASEAAAEQAAAEYPCAGNLLDPVCLQRCLQALAAGWTAQQRLNEHLTSSMKRIESRLAELETRPSYTIEKLEYNFDQLKVEQLDGTLNIGMTAPSEAQMQEFGQMALPSQVKGGAKVYPLPIPQSAAPGIAQQLAAQAAHSGTGSGIASTPAGSQGPGAPAGAWTPGPEQPSFGNAPGTALAPNLVGSQAPGVLPPQAGGQTLAPGAAAPPGFSGPPGAPNAGAAGTSGIAPPGGPNAPGLIPGSAGFGVPGAQSGLQPGPGAFTAPALDNFSGQPPAGSAAVPPAGAAPAPQPGALPGFTDVRSVVHQWLSESAHDKLESAARGHRLELDPSHRQMVIEDVRRQLPDRIRLYLNEELSSRSAMQAAAGSPLRREQLQRTAQRAIRDAETALEQYAAQLARIAPQRRKD
ncbi:spore germination protein GerPC [Paenibacillus pasadenensis]|uniref:spore germination protein GerPC n=1 Tax=Paenibacillus pasadenensis TaxID=217090 RepID=UPI00048F1809|nr:spore germination protein GerPC [Paenibacillus pasadenensis]